MSLTVIIIIAIMLSVGFHFVGVYIDAKKSVWAMLLVVWAVSLGTITNAVKPKGYKDIEKMKGSYSDTDKLIEEAMPEVSLYEMIVIKKSFNTNKLANEK